MVTLQYIGGNPQYNLFVISIPFNGVSADN